MMTYATEWSIQQLKIVTGCILKSSKEKRRFLKKEKVLKIKKISLRSLIAIVTLISFACSSVRKPSENFSSVIRYSQVKSGFVPIDKENPPTDGVWATWEDARAIAINNEAERTKFLLQINSIESDRDVALMRLNSAEKKLEQETSGIGQWLKKWGLPVGLLVGMGAGIGISFAARK